MANTKRDLETEIFAAVRARIAAEKVPGLFVPGDRVTSPTYGTGIVSQHGTWSDRRIGGTFVSVQFDDGRSQSIPPSSLFHVVQK